MRDLLSENEDKPFLRIREHPDTGPFVESTDSFLLYSSIAYFSRLLGAMTKLSNFLTHSPSVNYVNYLNTGCVCT